METERDVVRNEGWKLLKWVWRYNRYTWNSGSWWDLAEERERRKVGLSGLQGPKHYWRRQFCPAAGTDSCGDSLSLSSESWKREYGEERRKNNKKRKERKKGFGKSFYGLCHLMPIDSLMIGHSRFPHFPNSTSYLLSITFHLFTVTYHLGFEGLFVTPISNLHFYILNNITHFFTHFFIYTYFKKL